ncbi:MAG TPA: hypothetical protein VLA09_01140, partial [Longimicrobiales bacterium]|nr:hypothetical protein [Longimicrobiales bacterium]
RAGYLAYSTILEFVAANAERVTGLVERARSETVDMGAEPRGEVAVTLEYGAEDDPADYLLVRERGSREDTVRITGARLMKKPVPTRMRPRPWAYLLPRDAEEAVAMLRRHRITVERLEAPAFLQVQGYAVAGVTYEQAYNHAAALRVEVGEVLTLDREFPAGTYVVPTAQYLGRLAAHMLEPESADNVVYWNTMDAWIPRPGRDRTSVSSDGSGLSDGGGQEEPPVVPIYKLMRPAALSSSLVE